MNQQNFNTNARYYQDQGESLQNEKSATRGAASSSNNLMNNTLISSLSNPANAGGSRPITRDTKLRSQHANRNPSGLNPHTKAGAESYNQKTAFASNNAGANAAASAISGSESGAKTFQNTINIGSFINEINNQQQKEVSKQLHNMKTFSNTIENTDGSTSLQQNNNAIRHDSLVDKGQNDGKGQRMASILNTGSHGSTDL